MPWFPDFVNAAELARRETRAAGRADPVGRYFAALHDADPRDLERVWPGEVVVHDPRAGAVRGHHQLRRFVRRNQVWLAERDARIEPVATTYAGGRAVAEVLAHLTVDGREVSWPVAVVAESIGERSVVFRTYCSQWPVDGRRHLRPPILTPGADRPGDVVGRYQAALATGDTEAIVTTFAPDGYYREPVGPPDTHLGTPALRAFFSRYPGAGGVGLEFCAGTDDGTRYALEYTCIRWGAHVLPPQAGLAVHERGRDGLLAAVRVYDDVEAPG